MALVFPIMRRIARTSPLLYRVARPPWRLVRRFFSSDDYWRRRREYKYYAEVVRLARQHVPAGGRVIDVGAGDTRVLQNLDWFVHRVALDQNPMRRQSGTTIVRSDFLAYRPVTEFDLVICLQVVEHLDDPCPFIEKLFETGRTVIISVPYKWPKGVCRTHVQDPVDETKLAAWTRREAIELSIVNDGLDRLIAVYQSR